MDKILTSEIQSNYVKSVAGNKLTGTVTENKNVFDKFPQLVADKFNALIDTLASTGGAGQIGALNGSTATNVQAMADTFISEIANCYTIAQSQAYVTSETQNLVSDVGIDLTTGIITITKKDGTITKVDTALEKVPASFSFLEEDNKAYLVVTNVDGSTTRTDVTNLLNIYKFTNGNIVFTTSTDATGTTVSADIKDASITKNMLSATLLTYLEGLESNASVSANSAAASASAAAASATSAESYKNSASSSANASATSSNDSATSATSASNSASAASISATNAHTSEVNAAASATAAAHSASTFQGLSTVRPQYYLSTSNTEQTGGAWDYVMPDLANSTYLWQRVEIIYSDSSKAYTTAVLITGLNDMELAILDRYTKSEIDTLLKGKAEKVHSHTKSDITDFTVTKYDSVTMLSSGWNNALYSFNTAYPFATYDIEIMLAPTATDAQYQAWSAAGINTGSLSENSAKAYGIVPTIDIPIIVKAVTK